MERRKRQRVLSEEERQLWAHVTRNDAPIATQSAARHDDETRPKPPRAFSASAEVPPSARETPRTTSSKPIPQPKLHAPFDQRVSKKIARGRHSIDARLDLHGLRQHDAYVVLKGFLARSQAHGLRHVLVITGKGGGKPDDNAGGDFWRTDERGILRRLVPQWLAEPSFRFLVVSFTESALKHGGAGALYVTIRKTPHCKPHQ